MTQRKRFGETKMSAAERRDQIKFATAVADAMRALGATQTSPAYENGPDALVVGMGTFNLNTKAGPLRVHACGDWIPTQFEDAPKGALHVGADPVNGKWNWYPFMVGVPKGKRDKEHKTLAEFLRRIEPVLLPPGSPPVPTATGFDRETHLALVGRPGYAQHDFATAEFFNKNLLPSLKATAKREKRAVQALWRNDGTWHVMVAEDQPTDRAFVIVTADGKWTRGPKFDESIVSR